MRMIPFALVAVLATGLTACSGSTTKSTPQPTVSAPSGPTASSTGPAATGGAVHALKALSGNIWSPTDLTLAVGDSVKVTDADQNVPHNFVVNGVGRSDTMHGGDVFTLRFDKAGSYQFVCTFHESQGMVGTITVR